MAERDDIPNLTLRVLERIQADIAGMRGDIADMRGDIAEMRGDIAEMRGDIHELKDRFDHFLTFVGKDIQDLKTRVTALEQSRT